MSIACEFSIVIMIAHLQINKIQKIQVWPTIAPAGLEKAKWQLEETSRSYCRSSVSHTVISLCRSIEDQKQDNHS